MLDQGYSAAEWTIQTPRCLTPWFNAGVAVPDPVTGECAGGASGNNELMKELIYHRILLPAIDRFCRQSRRCRRPAPSDL